MSPEATARIARILPLFLLLLPFAVFWWMVPGLGGSSLGNDYFQYAIDNQQELLYSLEHGTFPLFCAGFVEGHSCAALTLGQLYHPMPHLAARLPGYWRGHALLLNTLLRLLELGVAHSLLFLFFKRARVGAATAFVASFAAVYNLRMLDMFRYGASLENYAAFVSLCALMGLHHLDRQRRWLPVAMVAASYALFVGGHPQFMYFGLLGAAFVALILPLWLTELRAPEPQRTWPEARRDALRFYASVARYVALGGLLAAPYLFQFYGEFIRANDSRVGRGYRWSLGFSDTCGAALGSLFRPLSADVHGAFGGSALWAATALLPLALVTRKPLPRSALIAWSWAALVFLVSLGKATILHRLMWQFVPLANSFRVPGRITMLLPLPLSLAWVAVMHEPAGEGPWWRRRSLVLGAAGALALLAFNYGLAPSLPPPTNFTPVRFNALPPWVMPMMTAGGVAALLALAATGARRVGRWARAALCVAVVAQTVVALRYGSWVVARAPSPTLAQFDRERRDSVVFRGAPGYGMALPSVNRQIDNAVLDPYLARFFNRYEAVTSMEQAYAAMATRRDAQSLVVEEPSARVVLDAPRTPADTVSLRWNNFNRYRFAVSAHTNGYLSVAFPWMREFSATVDGRAAPVRRANGYQIAIPVAAGEHTVELRYESRAVFWGAIVAALAFLLGVGAFARAEIQRRWVKGAVFALAALLVAGALLRARASLYAGDNLHTRYEWNSERFPRIDNLAFGRRTAMSSEFQPEDPQLYYSGRGVDGLAGGMIFATSGVERDPWWEVDLGGTHTLREIKLYGVSARLGTRERPLTVLIGEPGSQWNTKVLIEDRTLVAPGVVSIPLEHVVGRVVRLWVVGGARLSLQEVEVLGE